MLAWRPSHRKNGVVRAGTDLGPFLLHRSWIGDRDGNPNVTADITRWTFQQHRELALHLHLEELEAIRRELSASDRIVEPPRSLLDSIAADEQEAPLPDDIAERYTETTANQPMLDSGVVDETNHLDRIGVLTASRVASRTCRGFRRPRSVPFRQCSPPPPSGLCSA